jgi:hypothetical protein
MTLPLWRLAKVQYYNKLPLMCRIYRIEGTEFQAVILIILWINKGIFNHVSTFSPIP